MTFPDAMIYNGILIGCLAFGFRILYGDRATYERLVWVGKMSFAVGAFLSAVKYFS